MTERHLIDPPPANPAAREPALRSSRVLLRPLHGDDFDAWREVRSRCGPWLERWEPKRDPRFVDPGSSRATFEHWCATWARERHFDVSYGFGLFVTGRRFAGEVSLGCVQRGPYETGNVGYWIDEALAGRGYVPEGIVLLMRYAFETLQLHRVEAVIVPRNRPSIRVAEKLTMRAEGTAVRYGQVQGVYEDHVRYALTVEEWRERRAQLEQLVR